MQNNIIPLTNLLVLQKLHNLRPLIPAQLNNLPRLLVLLHRPVATEVLLKRLANPLDVQVVGQAGHGRDTLSPVALLDADVDFVLGLGSLFRVVEGVEAVTGGGGEAGGG